MNIKKVVGVAVLCAVVTFAPVANAVTVVIVNSMAAIAVANASRIAAANAEAEKSARIKREQAQRDAAQNQYHKTTTQK